MGRGAKTVAFEVVTSLAELAPDGVDDTGVKDTQCMGSASKVRQWQLRSGAAHGGQERAVFRAQASNSQTAPSLGAEQNGAGKEAVATSVPQHLESEGDEPRKEKPSRINLIPKSRWADGIPPVMGAHLMPSGQATPMSMSKGPGTGTPHLFYYPQEGIENYSVLQYSNNSVGAEGLADIVQEAASAAMKEHGAFTLVLSGGSLFQALAGLVGRPSIDYAKWHVMFVDERNVPHSSPDSNYKGAYDAFLSKVPIPKEQIYAIKEGLPVVEAATEYAGQLLRLDEGVLPRNAEGFPVCDLILLGMGPDGHVASLFPNRKQTAETSGWILPVSDSPKPPPERITFTLPAINSAKEVAIVAFGAGKAEVVQRALEVQALPGSLPAQLVRPTAGRLRWLLDVASAEKLSIGKWENSKEFPRST